MDSSMFDDMDKALWMAGLAIAAIAIVLWEFGKFLVHHIHIEAFWR